MIKIESGVKIPKKRTRFGGAPTKYPFADMKVGQSFFCAGLKTPPGSKGYWAAITGFKFVGRAEKNGYRIWRVS